MVEWLGSGGVPGVKLEALERKNQRGRSSRRVGCQRAQEDVNVVGDAR